MAKRLSRIERDIERCMKNIKPIITTNIIKIEKPLPILVSFRFHILSTIADFKEIYKTVPLIVQNSISRLRLAINSLYFMTCFFQQTKKIAISNVERGTIYKWMKANG